MRSFRPHVVGLEKKAGIRLNLNARAPALRIRRTQMRINEKRENRGAGCASWGTVVYHRGIGKSTHGRLRRKSTSLKGSDKKTGADLRFQHLERRVAAQEADKLTEHAVAVNTVTGAKGGLASPEWIPRYRSARLEALPIILIKRSSSRAFADLRKREWPWPVRRNGKGGHPVLNLDGHTKELVTQPVTESQIGNDFVRILRVGGELPLAKAALVRGGARSRSVKELRLRLEIDAAQKLPNQVLQVHACLHLLRSARTGFEARAGGRRDIKIGEHAGVGDGARSEIVRAVGIDAAILAPGFERVPSEDPGNVFARGIGSGVACRAAGITKEYTAKAGETARQRNIFPAAHRVQPERIEAGAIEKVRARACQRELQSIEGQMQLIDEAPRGRGSQARGEVVIVLQRGNPADAREKVFMLVIGVRILVKSVADRKNRLFGKVMVDAPGNVVRVHQ